ncbi:MAG: hypothetical protein M1169_00195 [Firmicutes bacterium]|nr:hypothetical protein [Bacillota bacterium]
MTEISNMEKQEILTLYNQGKILPLRAIYDVSFDPILPIFDNLGTFGSQLAQGYEMTAIGPDDAKNGILSVIVRRDYLTGFIAMNGYRVVCDALLQPPDHEAQFDFDGMKKHLEVFNKAILRFINPQNRQRQSRARNKPNIKRIGIRFIYVKKLEGEAVTRRSFYEQFLNLAWIQPMTKENDKLYTLTLRLAPDSLSENEREIQINMQAANLKINLPEEQSISFEKATWIDTIVGHFGMGSVKPDLSLLEEDHELVVNNILSKFEGGGHEPKV